MHRLLSVAALLLCAALAAYAAPSTNKVLILSSTISGGQPVAGGSYEAAAVIAAGLVPEVVSPAVWATMTAAQFGTYRAIVLGDASCTTLGSYSAAIANANTWVTQITGSMIVMGTDPVFHTLFTRSTINQWTINAINFVAADPTKVGGYLCLSCSFDSVPTLTPIPMLSSVGMFTARGVSCNNNAHIVAVSPALTGFTDATLSSWSCSVHNGFDSFPSSFVPLAIAQGLGGSGELPFADGSRGIPYILARGVVPVLCGDGVLQSPEECDTGALNGVLGHPCSSSCRRNWCGDGVLNAGEQCDAGTGNGVTGGTCSASCLFVGPSCPGGCGPHGTCVFMADGLHSHCLCRDSYSGPDCQCLVPSYDLSTDHAPVLDVSRSGFLSKDVLTLWVNASSKYYNVAITFKNELNASCNFPASTSVNFWDTTYHGPGDCLWNLVAHIPWGTAWSDCMFQRDETADTITFGGEMIVSLTEDIPPVRGVSLTRDLVETLPFQVVFPKNVKFSEAGVELYSPYVVKAAIVEQKYSSNLSPNGRGKIRLYTNAQWPYTLYPPLAASSSHPATLPITVTGPEPVAVCVNDGTSCQQWFDFEITPVAGQCNLNGAYTFYFMVDCNPAMSAADCPLLAPTPGNIVFTLESSWICEQVVANVDLSASMKPYATSAYDTEKYDYVAGATGYYLAHSSSSQITIDSTSIGTLTAIAPGGATVLLYDSAAGGNTAAGNLVSLLVTKGYTGHGTPANDAVFTLVYNPSFFVVPADSSAYWAFSGIVNVVFYNTQPLAIGNGDATTQSSLELKAKSSIVEFVMKPLAADQASGRSLTAKANIILSAASTSDTSAASHAATMSATALVVVASAIVALV